MSYAALKHNPQGEFCDTLHGDTSRANWSAWGTPCIINTKHLLLSVFLPWFMIPILLTAVIFSLIIVKNIVSNFYEKHT